MSEEKPKIEQCVKSSMEILSELFGTFDAEPPVIVKKEKDEEARRHKKSKKKHKHKGKKSKKKSKRHKYEEESSADEKVDLAKLLIKQERKSPERKIDLENVHVKVEANVKVEEDAGENRVKIEDGRKSDADAKERKTNEKSEKREKSDSKKTKIVIKDLKNATIFEKPPKPDLDEGEITDSSLSNNGEHRKAKHKREKRKRKKHSTDKVRKKVRKSEERRTRKSEERERHASKTRERARSRTPVGRESSRKERKEFHCTDKRCRHRSDVARDHSRCKSRDYDDDFYRERRDSKEERHRDYRSKQKPHEDDYKSRSRYRDDSPRSSYRDYSGRWGYSNVIREWKRRSPVRSRHKNGGSGGGGADDDDDYIDKKKLLEIARRNAIQMMKSGSLPAALTLGPQAQEKVLAAIKAGGKTIEELTDFCKTLSRKEELGELSSVSDEDGEDSVHHPFKLNDRSSLMLTNNVSQALRPLPLLTTSHLTTQFPVSSGTLHRKTEAELEQEAREVEVLANASSMALVPLPSTSATIVPFAPVPPVEAATGAGALPVVAAPPLPVPPPLPLEQCATAATAEPTDITSIVSERLMAIRQLQENPASSEALTKIEKSHVKINTWMGSKQQLGQFTGSTGAQILSQSQLAAGYQAWARKDQLQNAAPIMGGMGMHLLKKMGWNPGEGLGKEKSGTLEPLQLEVKLDKKGLLANEEGKKGPKPAKAKVRATQTLDDKHPVSLLGEYASKKKMGVPTYELCHESGPDHKKMFLFKVLLNGYEYTPSVARLNKKQAKAEAARLCLQQIGLLGPSTDKT